MKKFLSFIVLLCLSLAFLGCGGTEEVKPSKITVTASNDVVFVGETVNLKATVEPSNATNKNVSWTTSDPAIASVSSDSLFVDS